MKEGNLAQKTIHFIIQCNPYEFACLNVNQIANRLKVSLAHLSRAFKENMGTGLKDYLLREKLNRAKFLLIQNRRLLVKDVAIIFGFCTCDYFIKVFRNYVGISPGRYRKIGNGFFGLKDRRKGPIERRVGLKDMKKGTLSNPQFNFGNETKCRENEPPERRSGVVDRRKTYKELIK